MKFYWGIDTFFVAMAVNPCPWRRNYGAPYFRIIGMP